MAERYRQVEKFGVELNKTNDVSFNEKKQHRHTHTTIKERLKESNMGHTHTHTLTTKKYLNSA